MATSSKLTREPLSLDAATSLSTLGERSAIHVSTRKDEHGYQNHQKEWRQETEASPRAAETYAAGTEADAGASHQVLSLARQPRETMKFPKLLAADGEARSSFGRARLRADLHTDKCVSATSWRTSRLRSRCITRITISYACIGRCAARPRWLLAYRIGYGRSRN